MKTTCNYEKQTEAKIYPNQALGEEILKIPDRTCGPKGYIL